MKHATISLTKLIIPILCVVILLAGGYGAYRYWKLDSYSKQQNDRILVLEQEIEVLKKDLAQSQQEYIDVRLQRDILAQMVADEQNKNSEFSQQIQTIASTVGDLDKLSKTDEELLKKYSKVYFLNENYIPGQLTTLTSSYVYNPNTAIQVHTLTKPYLEDMITAARNDGMQIFVVSGYRSFGTQYFLKSNYKTQFGTTAANSFSADQGYSEHQLGTTVDITSTSTGASLIGFEKSDEYAWLVNNAYLYGFILSYPKDNVYYQYEPWHWRFVGKELARALHEDGKYFYDIDQREIDTYLLHLFD